MLLLMSWVNGIAPPLGLQKLGIIAARLGRLVTYQMMARGAAQLKALGFEEADQLTALYKEHVVRSTPMIKKALLSDKITVTFSSKREDF
jgi:hypothetical protein